jgi:hypothetical protein
LSSSSSFHNFNNFTSSQRKNFTTSKKKKLQNTKKKKKKNTTQKSLQFHEVSTTLISPSSESLQFGSLKARRDTTKNASFRGENALQQAHFEEGTAKQSPSGVGRAFEVSEHLFRTSVGKGLRTNIPGPQKYGT